MANFSFKEILIVDKDNGIMGTKDDYEIDGPGQIEVELTLNIPQELFNPIQVKVDFPPEFLPQEAIKGQPQSIAVPVVVEGKGVDVMIESLENSNNKQPNILALLKRAIFGEKN